MSAERPIVASILTRGWSIARTLEGDSIRGAFAKNLAAAGDPVAAATLTEGWSVARTIDGDHLRGAYAKNLAATGDPQSAAILTRGWAVARTRDGDDVRGAYTKNLAATGDAAAAAELTSGWAIAGTRSGDDIRGAYVKNFAATGDAYAAARLTSGWVLGRTVDGSAVREAFGKNFAATSDARAAAELTHAWAARHGVEDAAPISGDSIREAFAKNLAHTGDASAGANLTTGWVLSAGLDGATVRGAWTTNMQRLQRYDPELLARAEESLARMRGGDGTEDDVRRLFEVYGPAEVRDLVPQLRWRAIAQMFDLATERNDVARMVPGLLADARDHLTRLHPAPELVGLHRETSELVERNLARVAGDHADDPVRGYANHADYAEIGRIVSSLSLLDELDTPLRTQAPVPATPIEDAVRW